MRTPTGLVRLRTASYIWLILSSGCGRDNAAPHRALAAVTLPDLSRVAQSVRDQITNRYSSSMRTIESPTTSDADRAAAYGEVGVLLMAAKYRQTAVPYFANAQELAPADFRWPYYLAQVYRLESNLPEATGLLARVLQLSPDYVPALVWLAAVDVDLGRLDAAEPLLNRALTLQPESTAAMYWLGRTALARRDYRTAADRLEQGLARDKGRSKFQYQLAMAYRGLGDTARAEALVRDSGVREIEPDDPLMQRVDDLLNSATAYENRGNKALGAGKLADAAAAFRKAIELAPHDPSPRHQLGTVLFLNGDTDGAVAQFTDALRDAPTFAQAHYSLALVLDSRGQTAAVIRELTAAITDDPGNVAARLARADVWRKQNRWQESLADYRQALTLDPGSVRGLLGSAMALAHLKRFADARDELADSAGVQPNQPVVAHALARLLAAAPDARVRDGRKAMLIMQSRLTIDPRSVDLAETMAMVAAESGQWEEAATWQRQAIVGAQRAGLGALVQQLAAALVLYERRAPCRTPWHEDEDLSELDRVTIE